MTPSNDSLQTKCIQWSVPQTRNPVSKLDSFQDFNASEHVPCRSSEKESNKLESSTFAYKESKSQIYSIAEIKQQIFSLPPITTFTDPSTLYELERHECIFAPMSSYYITPNATPQNRNVSTIVPEWGYGTNLVFHERNYSESQLWATYEILPFERGHEQISSVSRRGLTIPEVIPKPSDTLIATSSRIWAKKKRRKPNKYTKTAIILHKKCSVCSKFFAQTASLKAHPSIPASHSSCQCFRPNNKYACKGLKTKIRR